MIPQNGVLGNFDVESTPWARMMCLHWRHSVALRGGIMLPQVAELVAASIRERSLLLITLSTSLPHSVPAGPLRARWGWIRAVGLHIRGGGLG